MLCSNRRTVEELLIKSMRNIMRLLKSKPRRTLNNMRVTSSVSTYNRIKLYREKRYSFRRWTPNRTILGESMSYYDFLFSDYIYSGRYPSWKRIKGLRKQWGPKKLFLDVRATVTKSYDWVIICLNY